MKKETDTIKQISRQKFEMKTKKGEKKKGLKTERKKEKKRAQSNQNHSRV